MKNLTVQKYLNIRFSGDPSKVHFIEIDYKKVKTNNDLYEWAKGSFELSSSQKGKELLLNLFDELGKRKKNYIILERNPNKMTDELKATIERGSYAWKQVLGFHLSRDHLVEVAFIDDKTYIINR